MRDHITRLELSLAQMRVLYGHPVVPPLADPPPPPPRLDTGSPAVNPSSSAKSESQDFRSFHSSEPERQANPPRHASVAVRGVLLLILLPARHLLMIILMMMIYLTRVRIVNTVPRMMIVVVVVPVVLRISTMIRRPRHI